MTKLRIGFLAGLAMFGMGAHASVEVVSEGPGTRCEELYLHQELKIFKDPTLFLSNLGLIYVDPAMGWKQLERETPLLTTVKGATGVMRLGPVREFRNFGAIARLYESAEPRLKLRPASDGKGKEARAARIVPIRLCGSNAYLDSLGFVLESDLKIAQQKEGVGELSQQMPPSVYPNPIPEFPAQTGSSPKVTRK